MSDEKYFNLGPTPCGEDCAQVGSDDYGPRNKKELRAYIGQLERLFPDKPEGVRLVAKGFPHDFGTYHEVVVIFDPDDVKHCSYACHVESNLPEFWDDEAKKQLI